MCADAQHVMFILKSFDNTEHFIQFMQKSHDHKEDRGSIQKSHIGSKMKHLAETTHLYYILIITYIMNVVYLSIDMCAV